MFIFHEFFKILDSFMLHSIWNSRFDTNDLYFICTVYFLASSSLGGEGVFGLAINALMADITKPENLAFRLGMIGVTSALAQPISPIVGAYIYSKFGYIGVFSATLIGMLCAGILLLIRIRPYKWKREKKEVCFIVTVICPCAELT